MRYLQKLTRALPACLVLVSLLSPVAAQTETIERIEVQGLSRMTHLAFMHALGVKVGDPYDVRVIRGRFRDLWELSLFEDITFETEVGPEGGRVLFVKLKERPVLSSVEYEDNKVVTRTQIEDRFKEREIDLGLGKPLDLGKVYFAESAIRDLFAEKGFLDAQVSSEVSRVTETSRALKFKMTPGGKTRIRKIKFTGNEVFSNRKLKTQLQLTKERDWYWPWSGKNLYHPVKWDQDVATLRQAYQNAGYLDVEIRAPVVEVRQKKRKSQTTTEVPEPAEEPSPDETEIVESPPPPPPPEEISDADLTPRQRKKLEKRREKELKEVRKKERKAEKEKSKRWVYLTVPVNEGSRYTLGEVSIQGNEVFPDRVLRPQISIRDGAILNNGLVEVGVDRITRLYEDRGYLYSTVLRRTQRREGESIADIEIEINEDKPYYVGRIEFRGNSATRDRVLRRELQLAEGELFSRSRLDVSRAKVNQLGYFQVPDEPVIEPIEEENRVAVTFSGLEQGRNEIQIGGGFSGLEGAFFNGVYSTRNFLGRGQVLSAAVQVGGRSNRYQLTFQEPWFMGKPYLLGVSLFRRDFDYGNSLSSTGDGFGVVIGRRIKRFSRFNVGYNFERVESSSLTRGTTIDGEPVVFRTENEISSLTPVYSFSTINNPYRPTRGLSLTTSVQFAGGPLGGTVSYVKPRIAATYYRRGFGRTILAFHGEAGLVREFGDESPVSNTANIEGVPQFQRFWLGGDTLGPRVFETRSITPRRFVCIIDDQIALVQGDIVGGTPDCWVSSAGVPVPVEVGGDRMYLFQSELVVPLNEQAEVALFVDAGNTLFEDTELFDVSTTRVSAGVELRFHLPIFPVPLRLIWGLPVRELRGDDTGNFQFSIGRSF